ncbi:ABC-type maltose transport system [Helicobacter felis]|uniref:ABC-type maltose transport system n=1 Tax=Helicobacter felis (strain ATCC 49179 / CCUG 28539 / NCTC 12436 / CS1) TaxID=936155 RepID=E7AC43_HELFC|nr:ABC-type maltose transport system [Helicobacter felis ATCC 49179]
MRFYRFVRTVTTNAIVTKKPKFTNPLFLRKDLTYIHIKSLQKKDIHAPCI